MPDLQRRAFFVFHSWACSPYLPYFFSSQKKKAKRLAPRAAVRRTNLFLSGRFTTFFQGLHPKPALLFSLQKSKQKASTPGSHKIYFYPGILQLPTVGQVKCLYNSVKNKFYRRLQRGALNNNDTAKTKASDNNKSKAENGTLFYAVQNSTRVSAYSMIFQI